MYGIKSCTSCIYNFSFLHFFFSEIQVLLMPGKHLWYWNCSLSSKLSLFLSFFFFFSFLKICKYILCLGSTYGTEPSSRLSSLSVQVCFKFVHQAGITDDKISNTLLVVINQCHALSRWCSSIVGSYLPSSNCW